MFAEIGQYDGKVVWLKVSANNDEESRRLKQLYEDIQKKINKHDEQDVQ